MSQVREDLLRLFKERSFKRGVFKLASGDTSPYYIDGKMTAVSSQGAYLIGEIIYEYTQHLSIDAIGGLETGAIPLLTAAVIGYQRHGRNMEGFWVRDKVKDHGTKKIIEGNLKDQGAVVIVEDVATKGESAKKAIQAVQERGCRVALVLTLVDRLQGAEDLIRPLGVEKYMSIFTIRDFGITENPAETSR
jgi:orotate phosphoribosyltransferase